MNNSNSQPIQDVVSFDLFSGVDLRIATVKKAEFHPNADKLLILQLDDGTGEPRQVCAGIKEWYSDLSKLVGSQVIIVANLEPSVIRGESSQGMVLAASFESEGCREVCLVGPRQEIEPGSKVS